MATKNFVFRGKAVYPMLIKPDEYMGNKYWKIGVALDDASKKLFKMSGLSLRPREHEDEKLSPYVTFKRKIDGKFVTEDDPPFVDNWDPEEGPIGNGSLVEVLVQVYDTRYGNKGHRLLGVKVLDLIPYEGETDQIPSIETVRPEDVDNVEDSSKKKGRKKIKKVSADDDFPF